MATIAQYLNRPAEEITQAKDARLDLLEFSKVIDYRRKIVFTTKHGQVEFHKADSSLASQKHPLPAKRRGPKPKDPAGAKWKATFHLSPASKKCLIAEAAESKNGPDQQEIFEPLSYGEIIDAALKLAHPKYFVEEGSK